MIFNDFQDLKISALGLGCMRLPHLDKYENIDISAVKKMVALAIQAMKTPSNEGVLSIQIKGSESSF